MTSGCVLCEEDRRSLYADRAYSYQGRWHDIVRCSSCGLLSLEPFPAPAEIDSFYQDPEYYQKHFDFGFSGKAYGEEGRAREYRGLLEGIRRNAAGKKMLEIGCAAGDFLDFASKNGFECTGLELSEWAVREARKKYPSLAIVRGDLSALERLEGDFDVILLADVLEHLADPVASLKKIAARLSKNGIVYLRVPSFVNSWYFPWLRSAAKRVDLGAAKGFLKLPKDTEESPPYHLHEYSTSNLKMLLNKSGLRVKAVRRFVPLPYMLLDTGSAKDKLVFYSLNVVNQLSRVLGPLGMKTDIAGEKV